MFVPKYVFENEIKDANFLIPANQILRSELRWCLWNWTHYGIMWLPENKKARDLLLARLAAIDAYDSFIFNSRNGK